MSYLDEVKQNLNQLRKLNIYNKIMVKYGEYEFYE